MQRSYLVKSPVHFADFGFFVKVGDILVHDTANANRLTVYRNGEVVKAVKQTALGIAAMVKNEVIAEVVQPPAAPKTAPKAPQKPILAPKPEPKPAPKPESKPEAPKKEASAVNWGGVDMSTKSKPKPEPKKEAPKAKKAEVFEIEDETI
jgi:hypothetical protein